MKKISISIKKIKTIILIACVAQLIVSCGSEKPKEEPREEQVMAKNDGLDLNALAFNAREKGGPKLEGQKLIEAQQKVINEASDEIIGFWVGKFGNPKTATLPNKINIAIAEVKDGKVSGHTICSGNFRPFTGTITSNKEGVYNLVFEEPGDDKYDGTFNVVINDGKMSGHWKPFKNTTAEKDFSIEKTTYEYDTNLGMFPEASQRLLTEEDVANIFPGDLELMRNEIYARHGYSFKNKNMRTHFDNLDWYVPLGIDIREKLTDIEVKNIDLIYQYEEYFEENMSDFGR